LAHHSATKKAIRQSARRNLRNRAYKSKIKTAIKQLESAENADKAASLKKAQQIIDRAAKIKIIKKNTASRKISKLTKKVNAVKAEA